MAAAAVDLSSISLPLPPGPSKFQLIGHRGNGMNSQSLKLAAEKENSILSFNQAALSPVDLVEFDVQVTRDGHAVIFHDLTILTGDDDTTLSEKRVTDLSLQEFLSYGPQKMSGHHGKPLLRRHSDGGVSSWAVGAGVDDCLCTLQEAFQMVDPRLGFNIELKFDDDFDYREEELNRAVTIIWSVISGHAGVRPVVFSSFHPDVVRICRGMQTAYPVFFLTEAGTEMYTDPRRNSLEAAIELCTDSGLQGIVSDAGGLFRDPSAISRIKEAGLKLYTYGELNNVVEAVYVQHLMGVDGVIVDRVKEITEAVAELIAGEGRGDPSELLAVEVGERTCELGWLSELRPQVMQRA